ncbi:MAG TPA: bifunctional [glutamine synthetase] adenylyltransferase/[glutamine synthetase]-adenylyl-L-tyrosine phosphorylase [Mycobacteriales bacterium]|nr:bifunctional [glutamine synthetase] adenylyltransferase/[glutamine synthetase]-adenylyl-L-tyrosine phosphorylase [Mycobacteriales bacterium]
MTEPTPRTTARLARLGFGDGDRAAGLLAGLGLWHLGRNEPADPEAAAVVTGLARCADPDRATLALTRLVEAQPDPAVLLDRLRTGVGQRARLLAVLGASSALADHLFAHPGDWWLLDDGVSAPLAPAATYAAELLAVVGADPAVPPWGSGGSVARGAGSEVLDDLRTAYRRRLLVLAAHDLTGALDLDALAAALADLAAGMLAAAHAVALARCTSDGRTGDAPFRLAVVAMGKCGGRELNYVSDVDVIFVAEPVGETDEAAALASATRVAGELIRVCGQVAWPVDAALRPEGKAGPLVRTLASHEAYYRRWARTWEFQALLKARPVAGDIALGEEYLARLAPLVWTAAERPDFIQDVQVMRRRVEDHVPAAIAGREVKLGPGGLRDVEFAVQLLQLVHGRADETLRSGTTQVALDALARGGYVGRADAASLAASYRFLRTVEHRLQLQRLRRTHLIPDDPAGLRWLARAMPAQATGRGSGDPVAAFEAERAEHAREVRRLHEKLFYRPLLAAVARVPSEALRLTPEAARRRLEALGFSNPDGALRHLEVLTSGVSRRAAIQRTLLPVLLGQFADAPDPDAGLLGYRQVSEALQDTPWYLGLLRDEGQVADRLATLLGSSRYVAELLIRAPEALRLLADDAELVPRSDDALATTLQAAVSRHEDPAAAVQAARALRRHELLRIASADLLGMLDVLEVGEALSGVAAATLQAALDVACREVVERVGTGGAALGSAGGGPEADVASGLPTRLTVIAMGRLGGAELGYGSDADVLFVHDPVPGADERAATEAAHAVAELTRTLLARPAPDPPLEVDTNLRPEGKSGPLVRTLASYQAYYRRWAAGWEAQALLRAAPVAGDRELGERFGVMIDRLRYPAGGLSAAAVTEIRRIKARVDAERLPRGADPATHAKLGRGGLADVEWTVQLLQLRYAAKHPGLRTTRTLAALRAAADAELLAYDDAAALEAAWRMATRARNAIMLVRGRAGDQLPGHGRDLVAVARAMGYPLGRDPGELLDDYRRVTRRARRVVERVFYE